MAIFDNLTNKTAQTSMALTKVMNKKAHDTVLKAMPVIYALTREIPEGQTPFTYKGTLTTSTSGSSHSIRLRGALPTVSGVTDQLAAVTPAIDANRFARAEFNLSHYNRVHHIGVQDLEFISGPEAAACTVGLLEEELRLVMDAFKNKLAGDFHGTSDQGLGSIGGVLRAISNNDSVGGTYIGISRADNANAGLRGLVDGTSAAVSLARIRSAQNLIGEQTGKADLVLCGAANYGVLQAEVDDAVRIVDQSGGWANYLGEYFKIGGTVVALDGYCNTQRVLVLDTSSWRAVWNEKGFQAGNMSRDPNVVAAYFLPVDLFAAVVCAEPRKNLRMVTT